MDPLSRKLNSKLQKIGFKVDDQSFTTNHLLFIDDLKLLAENEDNLKAINDETKKFFKAVGSEVNRKKSETNCSGCEDDAVLLEGSQGKKYLVITEDPSSTIKRETFEKVKTEIIKRTEKLCMTKLSGKYMFKTIKGMKYLS